MKIIIIIIIIIIDKMELKWESDYLARLVGWQVEQSPGLLKNVRLVKRVHNLTTVDTRTC